MSQSYDGIGILKFLLSSVMVLLDSFEFIRFTKIISLNLRYVYVIFHQRQQHSKVHLQKSSHGNLYYVRVSTIQPVPTLVAMHD